MLSLKNNSVYPNNLLYSTCNFDTTFTKDWLLLNMSVTDNEYNIFYNTYFEGKCLSAISANIRGYSCNDNTVKMWQSSNGWALHIDSSSGTCGCNSWTSGATGSEDNFGYHDGVINTAFSCTASDSSTTQWWIGSYVKPITPSPTSLPSQSPSQSPSQPPSKSPTAAPFQGMFVLQLYLFLLGQTHLFLTQFWLEQICFFCCCCVVFLSFVSVCVFDCKWDILDHSLISGDHDKTENNERVVAIVVCC